MYIYIYLSKFKKRNYSELQLSALKYERGDLKSFNVW